MWRFVYILTQYSFTFSISSLSISSISRSCLKRKFLETMMMDRQHSLSICSTTSCTSPATCAAEAERLGKIAAAYKAVDDYVRDGIVLGIGSGSTILHAIDRIAQLVEMGDLTLKACIPTSFQARNALIGHNLPVSDLSIYPVIDLVIDGADEADKDLTLIKGASKADACGGGCLTQEKIVAYCAKTFVVVADYRKDVTTLGERWVKGIPIEVLPMAYVPVMNAIHRHMGGNAVLRMAKLKSGPIITDNGNFILDWQFDSRPRDWSTVNAQLRLIPGLYSICTKVSHIQLAAKNNVIIRIETIWNNRPNI